MLTVNAGDLAEAVAPAQPRPPKKRLKPRPVSLEFEVITGMLSVVEAKHGTFANAAPASGDWPAPVQVDGVLLSRLAGTWPPDTMLELSADGQALIVKVGKSVTKLTRTDRGGAKPIIRTPPKPDRRHRGKVEILPDPVGKRVEVVPEIRRTEIIFVGRRRYSCRCNRSSVRPRSG